jgi:hypothetical protein
MLIVMIEYENINEFVRKDVGYRVLFLKLLLLLVVGMHRLNLLLPEDDLLLLLDLLLLKVADDLLLLLMDRLVQFVLLLGLGGYFLLVRLNDTVLSQEAHVFLLKEDWFVLSLINSIVSVYFYLIILKDLI